MGATEIVEESGEAKRLGVHRIEVRGVVSQHTVLRRLDAGEERGDGGTQLVCEIGHARSAVLLLVFERLGKPVERMSHGTHLGVSGRLDTRVEIALLDLLGHGTNATKRPRQSLGKEECEQERCEHGHCSGDEMEPVERALQVLLFGREELPCRRDRERRNATSLDHDRGRCGGLGQRAVEPEAKTIQASEVLEGLPRLRCPIALVRIHGRGHLGKVLGGPLEARLRRLRQSRVKSAVRDEGRQRHRENRRPDERERQPCAQTDQRPDRLARRYPTPKTVSTYRGCFGSGSSFLRRFLTCASIVRS